MFKFQLSGSGRSRWHGLQKVHSLVGPTEVVCYLVTWQEYTYSLVSLFERKGIFVIALRQLRPSNFCVDPHRVVLVNSWENITLKNRFVRSTDHRSVTGTIHLAQEQ